MSCSTDDLQVEIRNFIGGSAQRYRHALNRKLIYTEGVKAVAEKAGAYWLIDLIALSMAPLYAKAWLEGSAGVGCVTLEVRTLEERAHVPLSVGAVLEHSQRPVRRAAATVSLSLVDDEPLAFEENIEFTDFPVGKWLFFLGTDEAGPEEYVTTVCLPEEY